ncbi:RNA-directed DNA polymerase, eukaryota [Tanacetum coccineum]
MASILVNGSPTSEFQFHRGLKQGDPLAPYLFILIMESLHLSFSRVIDAGIFTGVRIDSSTMISHLFYADDAVFIEQCAVKYLGVIVGGNTSLIKSWDETVNKLKMRYLASKKHGGLGVSSFYALNRALLLKWVWRFLTRDNSLWSRYIHASHGSNGKDLSAAYSSNWSSIVKEVNVLKKTK